MPREPRDSARRSSRALRRPAPPAARTRACATSPTSRSRESARTVARMRRLLIPIFVVAFALGTVAAVIVVRQHAAPAAQESPVATTPDKDDDSDKDSSPRAPGDGGTPEQVLYVQED